MNLFPLNLDIRGRNAVVVGGGPVAERKTLSLLEAQALVTVIAPGVTPFLEELSREGRISHLKRPWRPGDGNSACLVFATTNDVAVNAAVAREAGQSGIPVCVANAPEEGTFTSPAVIRRGELLITISTGGRSPALARRIRRDIETLYGPEYADIIDFVGKLRENKLTAGRGGAYNTKLCDELLAGDLTLLLNPDLRDRICNDITNPEPGQTLPPTDAKEFP